MSKYSNHAFCFSPQSYLEGRSNLSTSCCSSFKEQDGGSSLSRPQSCTTGSSSVRPVCGTISAALCSTGQDSESDSCSSVGDFSLAVTGLRGNVSQGDPCFAGPLFKEVEFDERGEEDDPSAADSVNEGIIFYNDVCPVSPLVLCVAGVFFLYKSSELTCLFSFAPSENPTSRF